METSYWLTLHFTYTYFHIKTRLKHIYEFITYYIILLVVYSRYIQSIIYTYSMLYSAVALLNYPFHVDLLDNTKNVR